MKRTVTMACMLFLFFSASSGQPLSDHRELWFNTFQKLSNNFSPETWGIGALSNVMILYMYANNATECFIKYVTYVAVLATYV